MTDSFRTVVVIPTYNRGAMVVEAARSALAQTVPVVVVVVDDGSTDDTPERLAALQAEPGGERLRVVRQENAERGAARNRGAREVPTTEFLVFLDADDVLTPGHVGMLQVVADTDPDAPMVASAGLLCDETLRPWGRVGGGAHAFTLRRFLDGREPLAPTLTLLRRNHFEAVGGYSESRQLSGSEDWHLTARLLTRGDGRRQGEPTALVRRHPGNTMADADRMAASMLGALDEFFDPGPGASYSPPLHLMRQARAVLLLQGATQFYAVGRMGEARRRLSEAARSYLPIVTRPLWSWTWLRSFLPHRLTRSLREAKGNAQRVLFRSPDTESDPADRE